MLTAIELTGPGSGGSMPPTVVITMTHATTKRVGSPPVAGGRLTGPGNCRATARQPRTGAGRMFRRPAVEIP